jgi:two-component system, NarL family, response regulator DesR
LIRALICEDAQLLRAGLVALLSQPADIEVVEDLHSSHLLVPVAVATQPDVAVVDVDMPGGLAELRRLSEALPGCRILTMTGRGGDPASAPVAGSISKTASPDFIVEAVRRVAQGERVIDPDLTGRATSVADSPLTRREADVLREAAEGLSVSEIAERLEIAPGTVRNYISRAIAKTGTRNRSDAIRNATHSGWLAPLQSPRRRFDC